MATVIREVDPVALEGVPRLVAWLGRCLDRPAFRIALAAQLSDLGE
jgi:glutathione S-transferase